VTPELITHLREVTQIAGKLQMRLVVALFDFYEDFAPAGTKDEATNKGYLHDLVGNFIGDDRIIAWDIHNEPDNYDLWKNGGAPQVLDWLGRMADYVHQLDPNHLVTVGMGQYDHLWQAGPDGRRPIDYSDMVSIHSYNAGDLGRQLDELRSHTAKPIVLGEFGWPTGPACVVRGYTEDQQTQVYHDALAVATGKVVGVLAWTLRDYDPGPTLRWDNREEHYGLYRADGSLKPAAVSLRAYDGPSLPSLVNTDLPLSSDGPNAPDGPWAPIMIEGSGHHIKGPFRRAWELFGGAGSFGLPLTEAYERPEDGRVVQFFQAAELAYYPEATHTPGFDLLLEPDKIALLIVPIQLGNAYTAGRNFPPADHVPSGAQHFKETDHTVQGDFLGFYNSVRGSWRLGFPVSEEIVENVNGTPTRVQYFQNGRLEWNDAAQRVEASALGKWSFDNQCAATS
jgi:hypothetical protein